MSIYINKADISNIADIRAAADIIEEKDELTTYLGFCEPGTENESDEKFAILKIVQSGTSKPLTTRFLWANGLCSYHLKWSERHTYNYIFKKF